jgi:hypothetical protein
MNPIEYFFKLGDKFSQDIRKKADWDFYLLLIMFFAFFSVLLGNILEFMNTQKLANLGWSFVMLAILWFQYFGLKSAYDIRKMLKKEIPEKIEEESKMLEEFK